MRGISFASPGLLWVLLLIPLMVAYYIWRQHKAHATIQMPGLAPFNGAVKGFRYYLRHILFALRMLAILFLILALARPQKTDSYQEASTEGIDIVMAIDISSSMLARDFKPDRLEAAKDVATEFISGRPYDRIGLVVFSGECFTQCPLTTDHAVLINLLRELKSGIIEDGTALGNGLATAVNRIKDSDAKSKVIILLTDGVNNSGDVAPLMAADIAKTFDVRVYTIGVGSRGTAPYPVQTMTGAIRYMDMPVEIDEEVLRKIASITGGMYFRVTDNNKLKSVYEEIDQMEKTLIDVRQFTKKEEKFLPFAIMAFILLFVELLCKLTLYKNIS